MIPRRQIGNRAVMDFCRHCGGWLLFVTKVDWVYLFVCSECGKNTLFSFEKKDEAYPK